MDVGAGVIESKMDFNEQTQRLRSAVSQGKRLTTRRDGPIGQIFFCEGCCCGRADRGFPPFPKAMIKEHWKRLKLNGTIQLTISGCLGPCDLANVVYFLAGNGTGQWLGGLSEQWQYETLVQWASDCPRVKVTLAHSGDPGRQSIRALQFRSDRPKRMYVRRPKIA